MQSLEAYRFGREREGWSPAAPDRGGSVRGALTLVTYNVWFAEYRWEERLRALLDLVHRQDADIIALQEITPRHLERILERDWVREAYSVSDATATTVEPHGVLLLSRLALGSLSLCELPSRKDRKLLLGELRVNGEPLCVGNVHLESSPQSTPLRLAQLGRVLPSLQRSRHAVLMGDFNFDPGQQAEQSHLEDLYRDLWEELRGEEPGYTADTEANRMRLLHKKEEKRVRYDRVLLRSAVPGWAAVRIERIGTEPIASEEPDVFPSDHFGLVAVLEWRGSVAG